VSPHRTRVILVGDADQLPPVGPGRPFSDLVAWGGVPTARLEVLHRSALTSWIHTAAQDLLHDRVPSLEPRPDFRWVEVNDPKWILPKVRTLMTEVFGPGKKIEAEAQVLVPQRPGLAGIDAANPILQEALNPRPEGERIWPRGPWHLRIGDLVIQTRNDYDLGVFNGEIGRVVRIGKLRDAVPDAQRGANVNLEADVLVVEFTGHTERSVYNSHTVTALQLAYALTIHRTQGSEFPWAIVVCHSTHSYMLHRQLLYTGITRAKQGVVLVGDRKGLERAVSNRRAEIRNTTLVARLEDTLEPAEEYHPSQLEDFNAESPTVH
jgi:exodeoxyribonuclease V alpha subunit